MTATMMVSLRSLFSLALDFTEPDCLVFNLQRGFQFYFFNEQSLPDGLNYFQVGRGDDDEGKDEAEQVDEDDVEYRPAGGIRVAHRPDDPAAEQRIIN